MIFMYKNWSLKKRARTALVWLRFLDNWVLEPTLRSNKQVSKNRDKHGDPRSTCANQPRVENTTMTDESQGQQESSCRAEQHQVSVPWVVTLAHLSAPFCFIAKTFFFFFQKTKELLELIVSRVLIQHLF